MYSFRDNSFSVQAAKKATGRVVAWRELGIANSFTLEASFCSPGYNEEQQLLAAADRRLNDGRSVDLTDIPLSLDTEPLDSYQGRADPSSPVPDVTERLKDAFVKSGINLQDARKQAMAAVEDRARAPSVPKDEVELRNKCVESWCRDGHYTVEDLQLVGSQLMVALYHYCNWTEQACTMPKKVLLGPAPRRLLSAAAAVRVLRRAFTRLWGLGDGGG